MTLPCNWKNDPSMEECEISYAFAGCRKEDRFGFVSAIEHRFSFAPSLVHDIMGIANGVAKEAGAGNMEDWDRCIQRS